MSTLKSLQPFSSLCHISGWFPATGHYGNGSLNMWSLEILPFFRHERRKENAFLSVVLFASLCLELPSLYADRVTDSPMTNRSDRNFRQTVTPVTCRSHSKVIRDSPGKKTSNWQSAVSNWRTRKWTFWTVWTPRIQWFESTLSEQQRRFYRAPLRYALALRLLASLRHLESRLCCTRKRSLS